VKKVLILGATGLIGHSLYKILVSLNHRVHATTRKKHKEVVHKLNLFDASDAITEFDATRLQQLEGVLIALRPDVVLNCIGLTKRRPEINIASESIRVNAQFPHELNSLTQKLNIRMIHFSTDCVFNGSCGPYTEDSITTPIDAYGRTKALGEVTQGPALTIRSSFIGLENFEKSELLEWFLNTDTAAGFTRVFYSGISTIEMSRIISDIIEHHTDLQGLYQLAAIEPISKYDLLEQAKKSFGWKGDLSRNETVQSMPTLDGSKLQSVVEYKIPDWSTMMDELAQTFDNKKQR